MTKLRLLNCTALAGVLALSLPPLASAADVTVPAGTTETAEKTVSGTDTVTVGTDAALSTEDEAVSIDKAEDATNVVIDNAGTIQSSKERAIRAKYDKDEGKKLRKVTVTNRQGATIQSDADDALQFEKNATGSAIVIDNAGTIQSGGGQALDMGGAKGVSVTNRSTGVIASTKKEAIKADIGLTLDNAGTIRATKDRAILIDETDDANTVSIVNRDGATITADDADTIKVDKNGSGSTVSIDNSGTIHSGDSQALDLADARGVTVTNRASGVISAQKGDAVRTGIATTLDNYGTIRSETIGEGDGIDTRDGDNTNAVITNHAGGLISGGKHGISGGDGDNFTGSQTVTVVNEEGATIVGRAGSGVGMDDNGRVVNHGTITGAWDGQYMGDPNDDTDNRGVDGDGVDIDQHAEIENFGLIQGTGATGKKDGQTNHSEGVAAGGGTITNHAGATIRGYHAGILVDDGNDGSALEATTVTNAGTIEGQHLYALKLVGTFDDTLVNSGIIAAGPEAAFAVDMGAGNDSVTVNGGTITGGDVIGGDGTDSLTFFDGTTGTFTFDHDIKGFETARVRAGSVVLHGALEASQSVTVDSDATLQADRAFTTGDLTVNGTFRAASQTDATRTVTVTGTYAQGASGVLEIRIDGATSAADRVAATGTATLSDGATIRPLTVGYVGDGDSFQVVTSSGLTADPTALTVDDTSAVLDWRLSTESNALVLTAARASLSGLSGTTGGGALDAAGRTATGDMHQVLRTLEGLTSRAQVRSAMKQISPTPSGATLQAVTNAAGAAGGTIQGRLGAVRAGQGSAGGGAPSGFALTQTPEAAALLTGPGSLERDGDSMPMLGVISGSAPARSGLWAQGFGTAGIQGARGGSEGFKSRGVGFALGGDMPLSDDTILGVAATYSRTFVDGRGSQADDDSTIDSYQLTVYGSHAFDAIFVDGQVGLALNSYDSSRAIAALGRTADADYDGWQGLAKVSAGKDFAMGQGSTITPTASLQYAHTHVDSYTETGAGAISRSVDGQDYDTVTPSLGARIALPAIKAGDGAVMPLLTGTVSYDVIADRQHVTAAFVGGGGSFRTDGAKPARAAAAAGLGVSYQAGAMEVDAGYELELREKYQGHAALLRLRYAL